MFPARFTTPPPKGCDMTDDKKNKMVNKGDKEAKKVKVEQLKGVTGGRDMMKKYASLALPALAHQGPGRAHRGASLVGWCQM